MLRIAGLSLLLGFTSLIALLYMVFLPGDTGASGPVIAWEPPAAQAPSPVGERQVLLNKHGAAFLALGKPSFEASQYPFLHLAMDETPPKPEVVLVWRTTADPEANYSHTLDTTSRESLWLATSELPGWEGTIDSAFLIFVGSGGAAITINAFEFHPPGLLSQLRAIYCDLSAFVPWNRSSMNSHTGARRVSSFYPAPLFAGFFIVSMAVYLLLCIAVRSVNYSWSVAGLIFLGVWLSLDLVWHTRLSQQVQETRTAFAGKTDDAKLRVGPDAALYQFVSSARAAIGEREARVFLASSDDYTGLRAAYYFYPLNALWRLQREEIPRPHFLRSGDYLALLKPTTVELDEQRNTVTFDKGSFVVDTLVSDGVGTLVRVR